MIDNKVKLVIWDLDETFWKGTLSEEGITPVDRNADIVRELTHRGIVNSICSKNDFETAKAKLVELGIWEYFVFPQITFAPKGKAIAEMIENAGLRAVNVLFIDDNNLNLEEVKFFNPGIMALHPEQVLEDLLAHPHMAGKPDPELKRLKQYQVLQRKNDERSSTTLSNEEFLRSCNIRISIDHDVLSHLDRAIDLINRANQLNYTKKRLETPEEIENFKKLLSAYGVHAGAISAVDNYGEYGVVGIYVMQKRARFQRLVHFVFSCRTMNMGIEQFVYDMLERPSIAIAEPVSYGLESHATVDWITLVDDTASTDAAPKTNDRPLVLVGGCDLLQLASYCSSKRTEFVNGAQDEQMIRYDDPGFMAGDRGAIRQCEAIKRVPCWTYDEAVKFDEAVASSELALISMWNATRGVYLKSGGVELRLRDSHVEHAQSEDPEWFEQNFEILDLDFDERMDRILASFDAIGRKAPANCNIFILGCYTRAEVGGKGERMRKKFNEASRIYCERHGRRFHFVDIDPIVPPEMLANRAHFTPAGYLAIAKHILAELAAPQEALVAAQ